MTSIPGTMVLILLETLLSLKFLRARLRSIPIAEKLLWLACAIRILSNFAYMVGHTQHSNSVILFASCAEDLSAILWVAVAILLTKQLVIRRNNGIVT